MSLKNNQLIGKRKNINLFLPGNKELRIKKFRIEEKTNLYYIH